MGYHLPAWKRRLLHLWRFLARRSVALLRLARVQKVTAREFASGAALGVFLAFAAPPGLQLIPGLLLASLLGASRLSTALGVFLSNPLTMPLIYPASYKIGGLVTGYFRPVAVPDETREIWQVAVSDTTPEFLLVNMAVGLLLMGSVAGLIAFHLTGWAYGVFLKRTGPPETPPVAPGPVPPA